ncbi:MAG: 2-dehydropantoate 2-reductase [Actinomycetota bacterium]|nr:2-dehydropantoate 2-reductase [Actinomycetota bacterium]
MTTAAPSASGAGAAGPSLRCIVVVGAGAIGSLYAAHLASQADVWVLTRRPDHAHALCMKGLSVSGKSTVDASVHATSDPSELPPFDAAIVATKANEVGAAADALRGRSQDAVVMTCQNGLGADEIMADAGPWPLISAVTFMSGTKHDDCHVEYELDAPTWLGPSSVRPASGAAAAQLAEVLRRAGLKAEAFDDVRPALWSKLIFNATVNALSALTGLPHDRHFRMEEQLTDLGHLARGLVEEGRAVAAAAGVQLHEDPWEMNLEAVRRGETGQGSYRHLPSMLADVRAGRRTEVDFITGSLVREGLAHGVPVPLHLCLWRLVKALESSYLGDVP